MRIEDARLLAWNTRGEGRGWTIGAFEPSHDGVPRRDNPPKLTGKRPAILGEAAGWLEHSDGLRLIALEDRFGIRLDDAIAKRVSARAYNVRRPRISAWSR